jgi:hypothetical protein
MNHIPAEPIAWLKKLKDRYPHESAKVEEPLLLEMVRESLGTCAVLQISDPDDMLRYIALRVLLTPEQRQSRLIRGVLIRTLTYLDWDARKRLDFIYKHIIGRPVSKDEIDFGPLFVPEMEMLNKN